MTSIIDYINPLLAGEDLDVTRASTLLDLVFAGDVPEPQIAAFLTAMRIKGPTAAELAGLAQSLRSHAVQVNPGIDHLVDTCGTGGGRIKTCNVSTAAALVAAGAGVYVAKHGNRGITSGCGSADVLEALGVKIDCSPDTVAECIRQAHVGFMFAPLYHPAMKYVQPIRKALGFRTVFNILGPLANPAHAHAHVLGVADEALMPVIIEALKLLGMQYAMVVHSRGLDEISTAGPTKIAMLKEGRIRSQELDPADVGITQGRLEDLRVEGPRQSADSLRAVLEGRDKGPKRDIIALNAAGAIMAGGLAPDFKKGLALAAASIDAGQALSCLETLIKVSHRG